MRYLAGILIWILGFIWVVSLMYAGGWTSGEWEYWAFIWPIALFVGFLGAHVIWRR